MSMKPGQAVANDFDGSAARNAMNLQSSSAGISDAQLVRETLRSILDSPQFSKSKRYPALLEYVVLKTLEGSAGTLKERVIGVEVFNRPENYDPGGDPVVRITAAEVRRRLAQYFKEHPEAPVYIDLPVGTYAPEFNFLIRPADRTLSPNVKSHRLPRASYEHWKPGISSDTAREANPSESSRAASPLWTKKLPLGEGAVILLLIVAAFATMSIQHERAKRDFWWPVLHDAQNPLIVVGKTQILANNPGSGQQQQSTSGSAPTGSSNFLIMNDVVVAAQICTAFRRYGSDCNIAQSPAVNLDTLHGKSVVSIGANNNWTSRFLAPLRYQIQEDPIHNVHEIVEHKPTGDGSTWKIRTDIPPSQLSTDYAIIARLHSDVNDGMVVAIAGLAPEGTVGAGKFLSSPDNMAQLFSLAPKGWKGINFEAVLQFDVIQGSSGHSKVVAAQFW